MSQLSEEETRARYNSFHDLMDTTLRACLESAKHGHVLANAQAAICNAIALDRIADALEKLSELTPVLNAIEEIHVSPEQTVTYACNLLESVLLEDYQPKGYREALISAFREKMKAVFIK